MLFRNGKGSLWASERDKRTWKKMALLARPCKKTDQTNGASVWEKHTLILISHHPPELI